MWLDTQCIIIALQQQLEIKYLPRKNIQIVYHLKICAKYAKLFNLCKLRAKVITHCIEILSIYQCLCFKKVFIKIRMWESF